MQIKKDRDFTVKVIKDRKMIIDVHQSWKSIGESINTYPIVLAPTTKRKKVNKQESQG